MNINIFFLGPARDFARVDTANLTLGIGATIAQVREAVAEGYPDLKPALPSIRFAINDTFVEEDAKLAEGDEVALIPPVSGG